MTHIQKKKILKKKNQPQVVNASCTGQHSSGLFLRECRARSRLSSPASSPSSSGLTRRQWTAIHLCTLCCPPASKPAEHPPAVKGRVWGSWWSCRETHHSAIRIIHYWKEFYHETGWSGSSWNFHLVFAMTCDDRELAFLNSYYLQRDFLDIL